MFHYWVQGNFNYAQFSYLNEGLVQSFLEKIVLVGTIRHNKKEANVLDVFPSVIHSFPLFHPVKTPQLVFTYVHTELICFGVTIFCTIEIMGYSSMTQKNMKTKQ